uniref:serine/threonine-protein kinase Nek11-like n=2 Tax=Oncorhynchus gorbuscha TaxID=8017 RepID=UPI001EAF874E
MTPRERMRLRKLQAADDKARRLRRLAEEKYQENHFRMQELRSRHFEKVSLDVLNESAGDAAHQTTPITAEDYRSLGCSQPKGRQQQDMMRMSEPVGREIPEDPQTAEVYYYMDGFESCTDEEEEEREEGDTVTSETLCHTYGQELASSYERSRKDYSCEVRTLCHLVCEPGETLPLVTWRTPAVGVPSSSRRGEFFFVKKKGGLCARVGYRGLNDIA